METISIQILLNLLSLRAYYVLVEVLLQSSWSFEPAVTKGGRYSWEESVQVSVVSEVPKKRFDICIEMVGLT